MTYKINKIKKKNTQIKLGEKKKKHTSQYKIIEKNNCKKHTQDHTYIYIFL